MQHPPHGALNPRPPLWMFRPEGDMTTDLWARVLRLFGKSTPSRELEQVLAGWRAGERTRNSGSAGKREVLHPMKGWVTDSADRALNDKNPQWKVRHAAHDRTRAS